MRKIHDGLSNVERYRRRHPERILRLHKKRVKEGKVKAYYKVWNKIKRMRIIGPALKLQKGCCAICKRVMKHPYQDHSHTCCKTNPGGTSGCARCRRGLLCASCNSGLHVVESKRLHRAAIAYLKKWSKTQ